ncbi:MAG: protoheme IX farnesyltransferase [Bacteroidales bacterium]|nr:protoheme IX farnesyltransferase [Bacteroidales bacterium]MBK9358286.1 protoheme IX farnesyltransferase [Bacteroidales bacterium]
MKTSLKKLVKAYSWLGKFSISLPVGLTTFTGYLLANRGFDIESVFPVAGVFLLASAASALNQVQEHKIDLQMPRTRNRPIPSGRISLTGAWVFILIFSVSGLFILYHFSGLMPFILGIVNFIWYNGIYTPLKRTTAFAVVPGSVVGALPPLIGWVAAGGSMTDQVAVALGFFFFIGQIPHFWLLLLRFGHEYEMAGLQSLTTRLNNIQIRRLTFVWIVATATTAFMLPGFYRFNYTAIVYILWILSVLLVVKFTGLIRSYREDVEFRSSFLLINVYYFFVMVLLCLDVIL